MEEIFINSPYITLGQFLKKTNWISTGGEAKIMVKTLNILVNDEPENRRGRKLYPEDKIQIEEKFYLIKECS